MCLSSIVKCVTVLCGLPVFSFLVCLFFSLHHWMLSLQTFLSLELNVTGVNGDTDKKREKTTARHLFVVMAVN